MKLTGPAAAEMLSGEVRWDYRDGRTAPPAAGSELSAGLGRRWLELGRTKAQNWEENKRKKCHSKSEAETLLEARSHFLKGPDQDENICNWDKNPKQPPTRFATDPDQHIQPVDGYDSCPPRLASLLEGSPHTCPPEQDEGPHHCRDQEVVHGCRRPNEKS